MRDTMLYTLHYADDQVAIAQETGSRIKKKKTKNTRIYKIEFGG